jgi:hypothetical protein
LEVVVMQRVEDDVSKEKPGDANCIRRVLQSANI